jgi:mRNA deadenylase 3'-5' endonuclease subunit Ccr4/uncharacterized protein with PIN domain
MTRRSHHHSHHHHNTNTNNSNNKAGRKKSTTSKTPNNSGHDRMASSSSSWVDRLALEPIASSQQESDQHDADNGEPQVSLTIICWNVLAESYCSRNSHPGLPKPYQEVVFDRRRRGSLIRKILTGTRPDIWALQEVDTDEIRSKFLTGHYQGIETPRMKIGVGAGGKADSCGIYWLDDKWTKLESQIVRLDDLATLSAGTIDSINNNLKGFQQSFLRRNVALLVRLQHKACPDTTVVIAVAHLFWNPRYEYVKLCQTHYLLLMARDFTKHDKEPLIVCGDFNSLPGSSVHTYLSKGQVNARLVSPWNCVRSDLDDDDDDDAVDNVNDNNQDVEAESKIDMQLAALALDNVDTRNSPIKDSKAKSNNNSSQVRYLLDYTLNRLCRWFRILGLDAALESSDEEIQRTKHGNIGIFDRCIDEGRVLITTSNSLLARANCPAGTYLIHPKSLNSNWEIVLVHILVTHGVVLDPTKFLTRCVVCNGDLYAVQDPLLKRQIFAAQQAPVHESDDLEVYQCTGCLQGYWWSDRPGSSASRVGDQATRLFEVCLRAQVPVAKTRGHMFEHVDIDKQRETGWDWTMEGSELLKLKLQVSEWLKDEHLKCPVGPLRSAYGDSLPYTNVTRDFEGCLDYIFYETCSLETTHLLYVPKTYDELNSQNLAHGHLLPSNVWPSDHLALGARLVLRPTTIKSDWIDP